MSTPSRVGCPDFRRTLDRRMSGQTAPKFLASGGDGTTWRTLEVIVTPDKVQGSFDGDSTGELAVPSLVKEIGREFALARKQHPENACLATVPAEVNVRGGLGLYLYLGAASFREVSVTPLNASGAVVTPLED